MSPSFRDHAGPNAAVWTRFLTVLRERGVEKRQARWYVLRTEQFMRALPREDFRTYIADDVARYLRETGRKATLEDWQHRQLVDALEILFARALALPWANGFDWSFWKDSAKHLAPSHATIARDLPEPEPQKVVRPPPEAATDHRALLDVTAEIRRRAYSIRTEQSYTQWILRFIAAFGNREPRSLGATEVKSFLEMLAVHRNVAPSTQNQALSALVFLYREVLGQPVELGSFTRAKRPRRLPVVLTRQEVRALLQKLKGTQHMMASLLYGTGMRLMEVVRLRVKDIDFGYRQIVVRNAKGAKDRVVPLPEP